MSFVLKDVVGTALFVVGMIGGIILCIISIVHSKNNGRNHTDRLLEIMCCAGFILAAVGAITLLYQPTPTVVETISVENLTGVVCECEYPDQDSYLVTVKLDVPYGHSIQKFKVPSAIVRGSEILHQGDAIEFVGQFEIALDSDNNILGIEDIAP